MSTATLEKIVALCKRRGFVYQSADIYGGLNGVYDFGHLGFLLKQNIKRLWVQSILTTQPNILFMDGAQLGPHALWEASGHTQNFHDPLVDCTNCKRRFRADDVDLAKVCPVCGKKAWTEIRQFNMMFKTNLGALADESSIAYLRPETAQSIYVNFKNIISTNRVKIPFGVAQIGKAFRNEITPKQFLFRMREFEQMEMEWFCKPEDTDKYFPEWVNARQEFYATLGIKKEHIRLHPHAKEELSHYSSRTTDVEYEFPFGWKELEGIADRGDFDLSQHSKFSGKDLMVFDDETKKAYTPHIIESSVGVDRWHRFLATDIEQAHAARFNELVTRGMLRLPPGITINTKTVLCPNQQDLNRIIGKLTELTTTNELVPPHEVRRYGGLKAFVTPEPAADEFIPAEQWPAKRLAVLNAVAAQFDRFYGNNEEPLPSNAEQPSSNNTDQE